MTAITISNPFPFFTDTDGKALENGNIYIGVAGLDPETSPLTVYWDSALTITAEQPIRTIGGYPDNDGSASNFLTTSDFSILVKDSAGVLVYSSPSAPGQNSFSTSKRYVGDGVTKDFAMDAPQSSVESVAVLIDGIGQFKDTYTVSGLVLTFSEAPPDADGRENIEIGIVDSKGSITASALNVITTDGDSVQDKIDNAGFTTRSLFVTAQVAGIWADGDVVPAGPVSYARSTGATAISDMPGWLPFGNVTPDHFTENTTPFTTNMTTAVQAGYDYAGDSITAGGLDSRLTLLGGYRCTSTLTFDKEGTNVGGTGFHSTVNSTIFVDHISGPGVILSAGRATLEYFRIKGGTARSAAGAAVANTGLTIEPPDTASQLISDITLSHMLIDDHNGSGIVGMHTTGVSLDHVTVSDCRRHGIVFGNNTESVRTNTDLYTGQIYINETRSDADGHSLVIGAPDGVGEGASTYRVHIRSLDSAQGPVNSATAGMIAPCCWWVRGQNVIIENSAMNPGDTTGEGVILSGFNIDYRPTNRLLDVSGSNYAIRVVNWQTNGTKDLMINSPYIVGTTPAVAVVLLDTTVSATFDAVNPSTVSLISNNASYTSLIADPTGLRFYRSFSEDIITGGSTITGLAIQHRPVIPNDGFTAVASGVLDVTRGWAKVTGEGGVADDVVSITVDGGTPPDGYRLVITAGTGAQVITLKHGTGNIQCGSDRVLNAAVDVASLQYSSGSSAWILVSFQDNA